MDKIRMAKILLRLAKSPMIGVDTDRIFIVKQGGTYTLWSTYLPGSGTTSVLRTLKTYLTDKRGDKNYDDIVRAIARNFPKNKIIESGIYDYVSNQREYDLYGGSIKPRKKLYIVITEEQDYHIVSFFENKGEARYWIRD